MGCFEHLLDAVRDARADAVVMAHLLHYGEMTLPEIRKKALANNLNVRPA